MKFVGGFFGFWRDLVIGDCWRIAAAICALLVAGIAVLRTQAVPAGMFVLLMGGGVMVLVSLIILVEAAVKRRSD